MPRRSSIFPFRSKMMSLADPPGYGPQIEYKPHAHRGRHLQFFPGLKESDLPDGEGWAIEWIRLSTHCTTHLDAP